MPFTPYFVFFFSNSEIWIYSFLTHVFRFFRLNSPSCSSTLLKCCSSTADTPKLSLCSFCSTQSSFSAYSLISTRRYTYNVHTFTMNLLAFLIKYRLFISKISIILRLTRGKRRGKWSRGLSKSRWRPLPPTDTTTTSLKNSNKGIIMNDFVYYRQLLH